jgi:hypothetical protein
MLKCRIEGMMLSVGHGLWTTCVLSGKVRSSAGEETAEFRRLVSEHRGVELTPEEAADLAVQLLRVLYTIVTVARSVRSAEAERESPEDQENTPVQGQLF